MPRTPLEAYALDARFGKRSVSILDPRLRFCPICNSGIIEDEFHFLLQCSKYSIPREKFYNQSQHNFVDFNQLSYTELIIKLMNSQNFP